MNDLKVKQIINQRNISVKQFAEMLGITREHCYHVLRGENVSKKQLENMSRVLNMPIRDLYKTPDEIVSDYNPYDNIVFGRTEHYKAADIITFSKLSGKYGAFSNMSTAYPVDLFGHHCYTSEHLFIALRFSGYPDLQKEILEYENAMWCKKVFVGSIKYKAYHHPNWHDADFDVEVMKFVVNLKYEQNEGFRRLLNTTMGKIIVEDATMQNTTESVLKWGCQDLQKKDLIKQTRISVRRYISALRKEAISREETLKNPRTEAAQKRHEQKMKQMKSNIDKVQKVYEETLFEHCNYVLIGKNSMGKILTMIRDNGCIDYDLKFPLYFFEHEIK